MSEKYCILCDKEGHYTNECWSTHGLNTPYDREIQRLCQLANVVSGDTNPVGIVTVTGWAWPQVLGPDYKPEMTYESLYTLPPGRWNVYALQHADDQST